MFVGGRLALSDRQYGKGDHDEIATYLERSNFKASTGLWLGSGLETSRSRPK
jgi:hypothetical protein